MHTLLRFISLTCILTQFDLSNPSTLRTRGHRFSVTCAVASEDTRWLYTAGKDGYIVKWDLHSGRKAHTFHKVRPAAEKGKGKAKEEDEEDKADDGRIRSPE